MDQSCHVRVVLQWTGFKLASCQNQLSIQLEDLIEAALIVASRAILVLVGDVLGVGPLSLLIAALSCLYHSLSSITTFN